MLTLPDSTVISRDEQIKLFKKMRNYLKKNNKVKYQQIRHNLILSNLKLITLASKRFNIDGKLLEDLISAGFIGLCEAADRFDPNRGTAFSTVAMSWILKNMYDYLYDLTTIRVPRHIHEQLKKIKLGRPLNPNYPSDPKILEAGNRALKATCELEDVTYIPEQEEEEINTNNRDKIEELLKNLTGTIAKVIRMRYLDYMTHEDIAKELGISLGSVYTYISNGICMLKKCTVIK